MSVKKLWKEHKVWFFVLLPLIPLIFFKDLIFQMIVGSAKEEVKEAEKKDKKLKDDIKKENEKIDDLQDENERLEEEKDNVNVSEDWHKKE